MDSISVWCHYIGVYLPHDDKTTQSLGLLDKPANLPRCVNSDWWHNTSLYTHICIMCFPLEHEMYPHPVFRSQFLLSICILYNMIRFLTSGNLEFVDLCHLGTCAIWCVMQHLYWRNEWAECQKCCFELGHTSYCMFCSSDYIDEFGYFCWYKLNPQRKRTTSFLPQFPFTYKIPFFFCQNVIFWLCLCRFVCLYTVYIWTSLC